MGSASCDPTSRTCWLPDAAQASGIKTSLLGMNQDEGVYKAVGPAEKDLGAFSPPVLFGSEDARVLAAPLARNSGRAGC